ncbi:hypothetical protein AMELA_G00212820 [Ameiurus melas]|uniref:Interleukin-4 receptor alpha N-terminal domain-containing protein n=1 Tax=Ameiurus melas TaxID=219545 RepID=A0A7J6A0B4_AMEME|nr:hypothetical protein AMELA_G00212820 [Ameiurus melas]
MGALIIILQVTLLLSTVGFTESSELLQCFNDYDTELKCSLTVSDPDSCYKNKLNASVIFTKDRSYTCHFDEIRPGACECSIQVAGFVITEIFTVNVSKGDEIWHTKTIITEESIKPRRPIIKSVILNANGDVHISLNTTYTKKPFSDSLIVELTYGIVGSNDFVTQILAVGQTVYEIVGRHLQPNSRYTLRARVKSNYPPNKTFSDYSEAHVFKTPLSLQNLLKIITPILCLILIICVSSIYFWFNRVLKPWWDKIPTPKFSTNFVKQVPQLLSIQNEFSSVSLDPTANHKKTCVESSQVQCKDVNSAPLICSTPDYQSVEQNSSEGVRCGLDKENQSTNLNQSNGFSSGISNRSYSLSDSSSSPFFKQPVANIYPSENFLVLSKNLDPTIQTDFQYSVCSTCTDSGISELINIMPPKNETAVVLGYQSLDNQDCDDEIIKKPISIKEPQDGSVRENIIPMDEGYQAF